MPLRDQREKLFKLISKRKNAEMSSSADFPIPFMICAVCPEIARNEIFSQFSSRKKYPPQNCTLWALEDITERRLQARTVCELQKYSGSTWMGQMATVKGGVAVFQRETSILQVWRVGDPEAGEFIIPDGECQISGMYAMENVLGKQEILALAFSNKISIGFFSIELSGLVKVRDV